VECSAYVSIRQHTMPAMCIRQQTSACCGVENAHIYSGVENAHTYSSMRSIQVIYACIYLQRYDTYVVCRQICSSSMSTHYSSSMQNCGHIYSTSTWTHYTTTCGLVRALRFSLVRACLLNLSKPLAKPLTKPAEPLAKPEKGLYSSSMRKHTYT